MKRFLYLVLPLFLFGCREAELSPTTLQFEVRDESGNPVQNAKIALHRNKQYWARWTHASDSAITDASGRASLPASDTGVYFFNITAGERSNRFTTNRYSGIVRRYQANPVAVTIRPYTDWEKIMGGGSHLAWKLLKLKTADGVPLFDYPVVTDMYLDGRWYDSNGRLGLWWFSPDESKIYYDYATTGAIVESEMTELREDFFQARIDFFGIVMIIEMIPV